MAKAKPVESKDTKKKILQLIPARQDLMVTFVSAATPSEGEEAAPPVTQHGVALALCENADGEQYVRVLTVDDLIGFAPEGFTFDKVSV